MGCVQAECNAKDEQTTSSGEPPEAYVSAAERHRTEGDAFSVEMTLACMLDWFTDRQ